MYLRAGVLEPAQAVPLIPLPLVNASLAPELKAAAEQDHISLSSREVVSNSPVEGDAVVIWIGATHDRKTQQWLVQLKRGIVTPEEQAAHRGHDKTKYLSWGSVVVFHSEVDAVDLWIAGPVTTSGGPRETGKAAAPAETRRSRVFVPRDYLRLGLDDSARASLYMSRRIQAIVKEDPKFGVGNIYSLDSPIKPENIAYAKPVAARIGFTPAMEQAWMGGYVALEAFYDLVNDLPDLRRIADIALERPAAWKLLKLAFGTNFQTFFGGPNSRVIDPAKLGLLPVGLDALAVPFSFNLGEEPIVSGEMIVTAPMPPLDVGAGVLGLIASNPKDRTRVVELMVISENHGRPQPHPKP